MGYSAHVELWLRIDGDQLVLGQVGPEWVILADQGIALRPCEAELILRIDDHETRLPVFLPDGISPDKYKTHYKKIDPASLKLTPEP